MGNNSWTHSAFVSRHLVPQNVENIIFVCYFLNIVFVIFSILSQIQIADPFEKSIPGVPRLEPHRKVNATTLYKFLKLLKLYEKLPTCVQTLTFCRNLGFQKPWICPWISHGFSPPPRIFGEAAGAADKKCGGAHGNPWEPMGTHGDP